MWDQANAGRKGRPKRPRNFAPSLRKPCPLVGLWALIGLLLCISASTPAQEAGSVPVNLSAIRAAGGASSWEATLGQVGQELEIQFNPKPDSYPHAVFQFEAPQDWSRFETLLVDVENRSPTPIQIALRIDDRWTASGTDGSAAASITLAPGAKKPIAFPLQLRTAELGMHYPPLPVGREWMLGSQARLNLRSIVRVLFYVSKPTMGYTIRASNARLLGLTSLLAGLCDPYGQWAAASFPGKVTTDQELAADVAAENYDLATNPRPAIYSRYGGYLAGPRVPASGRFETLWDGGRWWLIDPEGYRFLSMGVNGVSLDGQTNLNGRSYMFQGLPSRSGRFRPAYSGVVPLRNFPYTSTLAYNHFLANLIRKFPVGADAKGIDLSLRRLRSWGFNTLGAFSDKRTYVSSKLAYTHELEVKGNFQRISPGDDLWGPLPDPFDSKFTAAARSAIRSARFARQDPWCLGWFVDNEITVTGGARENGRYGIALGTLRAPSTSPAKQEWIRRLRIQYSTIGNLNVAWATSFATWASLSTPVELTADGPEARREDFRVWALTYLRSYFKTVRDQIKSFDSRALYLGCRFWRSTPEAIQAASEQCDVLSFNVYRKLPGEILDWANLANFNKPIFVGEFHFGAADRNHWNPGYVPATSMEDRTRLAQEFMSDAVRNPGIVGFHWFQYLDQPITGRWFDGENMGIGLVSVTDRPWPELRDFFRRSLPTLYGVRAGL